MDGQPLIGPITRLLATLNKQNGEREELKSNKGVLGSKKSLYLCKYTNCMQSKEIGKNIYCSLIGGM